MVFKEATCLLKVEPKSALVLSGQVVFFLERKGRETNLMCCVNAGNERYFRR